MHVSVPWLRRKVVVAAAASLLLAVFGWQVLRRVFVSKTIPAELVGVWETNAPAYADRALEFTRSSVIFRTGADALSVHRIQRVHRTDSGGYIDYRVEYLNREEVETFSFKYVPPPRELIRLDHQLFVWRKQRPQ
jgi:hypothetical protein